MKKLLPVLAVLCAFVFAGACRHTEEPYNRSDYKKEYERLFRRNVFAQCENMGTFYATYCWPGWTKNPPMMTRAIK